MCVQALSGFATRSEVVLSIIILRPLGYNKWRVDAAMCLFHMYSKIKRYCI